MLKFLAPRIPRRTSRPSLKDIRLDEGRSRIVFNDISGESKARFLVVNHLPPAPEAPSDVDSPNSSLCPPYHIHLREDETFRVISGQAKFLLLDQNHRREPSREERSQDGITHCIVPSHQMITIPRGQIHTFRNASSSNTLVLEFGFSPPGSETADEVLNSKMKHFFLNTQLYRSDCTSQGIPRSLFQILLFNHHADVALVPSWLILWHKRWPALRGFFESIFAQALGRVMNLFGGVMLGRWMFGLRSSYGEYFPNIPTDHPPSSQPDRSSTKGRAVESKSTGIETKDEMASKQRKDRQDAPEWACQAWRDHSFDGQSDSWRK